MTPARVRECIDTNLAITNKTDQTTIFKITYERFLLQKQNNTTPTTPIKATTPAIMADSNTEFILLVSESLVSRSWVAKVVGEVLVMIGSVTDSLGGVSKKAGWLANTVGGISETVGWIAEVIGEISVTVGWVASAVDETVNSEEEAVGEILGVSDCWVSR